MVRRQLVYSADARTGNLPHQHQLQRRRNLRCLRRFLVPAIHTPPHHTTASVPASAIPHPSTPAIKMTGEEPRPTLPPHLICRLHSCVPTMCETRNRAPTKTCKPLLQRSLLRSARTEPANPHRRMQPAHSLLEGGSKIKGPACTRCAPAPRRYHTGTTPAPLAEPAKGY